VEATGIRI